MILYNKNTFSSGSHPKPAKKTILSHDSISKPRIIVTIDVIKYLSEADANLGEVIISIGEYSIKIRKDPFQSLIESIFYQKLAGSAASAIYDKFLKYYNNSPPSPHQIISTPNSTFKSSIGLSNNKIEAIKNLSAKVMQGTLDLSTIPNLTDEEIVAQLIQVKGIGRWTAEMFLIFCLGRLDILPVTDLGVRKAMQKIYTLPQLPKPAEMLSISQPWKPYRAVATWYLWKSVSKFKSMG
jgi:DNA-3-methyladenine glycosylase II